MKNLKQLLGICEHKWIILKEIDIYPINQLGMKIGDIPTGGVMIFRCEKCGKVKSKRV